jgi:hypothetical protein
LAASLGSADPGYIDVRERVGGFSAGFSTPGAKVAAVTEEDYAPARNHAPAVTGAPRRKGPAIARQILAFALETALLFAVAYGAVTAFPGYGVLAAAAALAAGVLLWGMLMAPRARNRLPWPALPLVAAGAFLAGAGTLMLSGLPLPAVLMTVAAVINLVWDLASGHPAVAAPARTTGRRSARR